MSFHFKPKYKRLSIILFMLSLLGIGIFIICYAFDKNIVFYYLPSELSSADLSKKIRIGGYVEKVVINNETISFYLKDEKKMIKVFYKGILPDLFAEGKGAVVEGCLTTPSQFMATTVLAKHDENYKPPNTTSLKSHDQ